MAARTKSADRDLDRLLTLCRQLTESLGGRYSAELGIAVDRGDAEVERWFLAATLFGARISARIAERTFAVLSDAGLVRIGQARQLPQEQLIGLLDAGGYARYDFRTATRLADLAEVIDERYGGEVAALGRRFPGYRELAAALDALPGWGAVTIGLFLRELRGIWPGARPPLDRRAVTAAGHLGLLAPADRSPLDRIGSLAAAAGLDIRDLESALVRLTLAHRAAMQTCRGGYDCTAVRAVSRPA